MPPSRRSRSASAVVSAPLPPTARPGARRCISMFQPTRSAVATSCPGGPDCAPSQASAVFRRSSVKCSSSSWSAGCRNCRDISSPPTSAALPAPQRCRPSRPAVGTSWKASNTAALRADQSRAKRAVGLGVAFAAEGSDRRAGGVEVDVERQRPLVVAGAERREPPRVHVEVAQAALVEAQVLDDAGVPHHDVRARAPVDGVPRPALDGRDRAAQHGVPLDHLDVEAGPGQVAGGDQRVVAAADDDDVPVGHPGSLGSGSPPAAPHPAAQDRSRRFADDTRGVSPTNVANDLVRAGRGRHGHGVRPAKVPATSRTANRANSSSAYHPSSAVRRTAVDVRRPAGARTR